MTKFVYGIDLGTTYSCIARIDETGRATVIDNSDGTNTTPSVVNFASPNEVVVGQIAKETAVIDPENTVSLVKTLMGRSDFATNYNGRDISPEEVSAYILKKIAEDASAQIGDEVVDVVITCPAYFGTAERMATKNAGEIAGLNVLEIISEPVAAAIYYGCTKEQAEKTILVYDLGGGTFDVTIMRISGTKVSVVCADGDHDLGGKDWDSALMRYLSERFCEETGYDGDFDEYAQQDLRLKAEKAKMQLSGKEETPVMLDVAGLKARIPISRTTFEELTQSLLNSSLNQTDAAIALAKEKGFSIDEILLVGGSTRMPQVTKALVSKYGIEPKILEPDEAVAKGAAVYAVFAYIEGNKLETGDDGSIPSDKLPPTPVIPGGRSLEGVPESPSSTPSITIEVATTKSFAVRAIDDTTKKLMCFNLIYKNSSMPDGVLKVTDVLKTLEANQSSVLLPVYESDRMDEAYDVDEKFYLGEALLEGLPPNLPAGAPIEVTFVLNREGILELIGRDLTGNREVRVTLQTKGVMSTEKVQQAKDLVRQVKTS